VSCDLTVVLEQTGWALRRDVVGVVIFVIVTLFIFLHAEDTPASPMECRRHCTEDLVVRHFQSVVLVYSQAWFAQLK
jgi:hypothetical protein